jgi:hypothetical protein
MRVFAALDDTFGEKQRMECTGKTREFCVLQRLYTLFSAPGLMNTLVLGVISQFCCGFLLGQAHVYRGRPDHSVPSIPHHTKESRVTDSTKSNSSVMLRAVVTAPYRSLRDKKQRTLPVHYGGNSDGNQTRMNRIT